MTTGPVDATPGGQVAAVPSGVARGTKGALLYYLARYLDLVISGQMQTRPTAAWQWHLMAPADTSPRREVP